MCETTESTDGQHNNTPLLELIGFLEPKTRPDVRRAALECVIALSASVDGSAGSLFMANDCTLGKSLCQLGESELSDRGHTLSALTNFSSESPEVADFILMQSKCAQLAFDLCLSKSELANVAARLLSNLSRHFPYKVNEILGQHNPTALDVLVEIFSSDAADTTPSLVGYTLVNLSSLSSVRHWLVDHNLVARICGLTTVEEKKEMAVDILRNLSFEEALHPALLDESDTFLVALLAPLADREDCLSDEENEKLPIILQYYEGIREKSLSIRQKLVEALYQLCATRYSRERLRRKGVYAILRELDRAEENPTKKSKTSGWIGELKLLAAQQEHTLHALIGILIRNEDEMAVDHLNEGSLKLLK